MSFSAPLRFLCAPCSALQAPIAAYTGLSFARSSRPLLSPASQRHRSGPRSPPRLSFPFFCPPLQLIPTVVISSREFLIIVFSLKFISAVYPFPPTLPPHSDLSHHFGPSFSQWHLRGGNYHFTFHPSQQLEPPGVGLYHLQTCLSSVVNESILTFQIPPLLPNAIF